VAGSIGTLMQAIQALLANPDQLQHLLETARARRAPLESEALNAYRLVNGAGDGLPGLSLDRFDQVLILSLYETLSEHLEQALIERIAAVFQPTSIYLKRRPKEARHAANTEREYLAPPEPAWGEPVPELEILEHGVKYQIQPGGDLSVGLFLDMRPARAWLKHNVSKKRVLNAFSYTCGFGLVSSLGGSGRSVNLDLSRRVLDWGEINYRLNHLEPQRQDFIAGDVFDWFKRMQRWQDRFDLIVLDPPSFAKSRLKRFSAAAHYHELVALAAPLLEPGGTLLTCCNHAGLSRTQFLHQIEAGLREARRERTAITSLAADPIDFPDDGLEGPLKVIAVTL
jgi:23S rRNA (cytosine1962-C5)-methyltransferase